MYPTFDEEIKLEHLQGYLYGQQAIKNIATANPGSFMQYSILELDPKPLLDNLKWGVAQRIINELAGYLTQNEVQQSTNNLYKNSRFELLENWEIDLALQLEPWFINSCLHINTPPNYYEKKIDPKWTTAQKEKFIKNGKAATLLANKRLTEIKPASRYFIHLLQLLLGNKLTVHAFKNLKNYPRKMDLHWGMQFNFFLIKNEHRFLLLHLGRVLT